MNFIKYFLGLILILIVSTLLYSCRETTREVAHDKSNYDTAYQEQEVSLDSDTLSNNPAKADTIKIKELIKQQVNYNKTEHLNSVSNMPPYYEKGYEAGYDAGEEDAVNENGWQATYDDSNPYKGKKADQYTDGYEDGYQSGYEDYNED